MGVVSKESKKSTFLLFAGAVLGYLNIFIFLPLVFSPGEIGGYRVIIDAAWILVPFLQFGLPNVANKFFNHFTAGEERETFSGNLLALCGLLLIPLVIVMILAKEEIQSIFEIDQPLLKSFPYSFFIVTIIIIIINSLLGAILRNNAKVAIFYFTNEVIVRLTPLIVAICAYLGFIGFEVLLLSIPIAYSFQTLFLGYHSVKSGIRCNLSSKFLPSPTVRKKMLFYAGFMILGTSTTYVIQKVDTVMTAKLINLESAGIYTIAFFMSNIIEFPRRALNTSLYPFISKYLHESNFIGLSNIYKRSSINQLMVGAIIFSLILINIDAIYQLIPNGKLYEAGRIVFILVGISKLLDLLWGANSEILLLSDYYKNNIWIMIITGFATIGLNLWLIPIYGLVGTALATLLTVFIHNNIKGIFLFTKLNILPFSKSHLKILLTTFPTSVIIFFFLDFTLLHPIFSILIKSTIYCLLTLLLFIWLKPSEDLYKEIKKLLPIK